MIISGTLLGFVSVTALFLASLVLAYLDWKEKSKGNVEKAKLLSKAALALFLAAFIGGVSPQEIIFTSGTTASINLVASCFAERYLKHTAGSFLSWNLHRWRSSMQPLRSSKRLRRNLPTMNESGPTPWRPS